MVQKTIPLSIVRYKRFYENIYKNNDAVIIAQRFTKSILHRFETSVNFSF